MFGRQLMSSAGAACRALPSLGLAAALLLTGVGGPAPAAAQGPIIHDHRMGGAPVARVQVIMHSVKILDDRDGRFAGQGEFKFWYTLVCAEVTAKCLGENEIFLDGYERNFKASTGETFDLKQTTLPIDGSPHPYYNATAATGYPLYPGHNYRLRWGMEEYDAVTNPEQMGDFRHHMTPENGWGVGVHTMRSVHNDGSPGDFALTYEVRPMPLPDLRPVNIKVEDIPGSTKKHVCTAVQNIELGNVGSFEVSLHLDGSALFGGVASAPGLTPGNHTEVCAEPELPTSGEHKLMAMVDLSQAITEYNEGNNTFERSYTGTAPAAGPVPSPGPILIAGQNKAEGQDQADLTVSAIKVNGRVPDGKDDCKDGKNAVAVLVKNAGTTKAGAFAVRLGVDDGEAIEEAVDGLEAGKEREVRFGDIRLKKGEHQLAATVDPKTAIDEFDDGNNGRTVTATCRADG